MDTILMTVNANIISISVLGLPVHGKNTWEWYFSYLLGFVWPVAGFANGRRIPCFLRAPKCTLFSSKR